MKKLKEWPKNKKIIAIDFDGTITRKDNRKWTSKNGYTNDLMLPRVEVINYIKKNRDNYYFILWTCRTGKALKTAIKFCEKYGIKFDAVNENIVRYKSSRKIMADYYLDDKGREI